MPLLELLGRGVPLYGLLGVLGACLGLVCALVRCPSFGLSRDDCAYLYVFGAIGAAAGAKLLYLLPRLPQLAAELPLLWEGPAAFAARWLSGGLVFYGGLFGGIAGAWLAARYFRADFGAFCPVLVPAVPLMHALGRVGCFFTGCCYGVELDPPWGIPVPAGAVGPGGVRFPVQLWEAGAEGTIFLLLLRYSRRAAPPGKSLAAYLLLYAPVRFALEFFRGDPARGFLGPLSTSQWLSLAAAGAALAWLARRGRNHLPVAQPGGGGGGPGLAGPPGAEVRSIKRSRCGIHSVTSFLIGYVSWSSSAWSGRTTHIPAPSWTPRCRRPHRPRRCRRSDPGSPPGSAAPRCS